MSEPKRKSGRPPKHIGLATPAVLKKVSDGVELRDLREAEPLKEGPILHAAPAVDATPTRKRGVFGASDRVDGGRGAEALVPAVLNAPGLDPDAAEPTFTDFLKKIANEIAPAEFQDAMVEGGMTGLELLARKVFYAALANNLGSQRARELVVDRLEGKAVRAAQVQTANSTVEDQIDEAAVALLNGFADPTPDKEASNVS